MPAPRPAIAHRASTRPTRALSRRHALRLTTAAALGTAAFPFILRSAPAPASPPGHVIGEPTADKVGQQILASGGNAIDAIVAAALASAVAAPNQTGIGGYGMSATIALAGGRQIVSIDGNSTAPAALRPDAFPPGPDGKVPGRVNESGWLAAGVPGVLAGLHLALEKFGTRPFSELLQPAIAIARNGFPWPKGLADVIAQQKLFATDPGSRKLFFPDGQPLAPGALFKNPELAELLTTLAKANSIEPFYRGDLAQRIAEGFQKNGGLVTAQDLAAHRARVVEPLTFTWGAHTIHTAPLTAGGLTVLQILRAMHALNWDKLPAGLARTHARLEAARLAWRDRLTLLGDPDFGKIPVARLLSADYARESADQITAAIKAGKPLAHAVTPRPQNGTISLSAADQLGNFVALTLTHGEAFGARVTVEGLGLTLGHGMSRFDPNPAHPNAPGPGKRPLHNMVPTIVTRDGTPVLAIGGRGGRKIPNALLDVLTHYVVLGQPLASAMAAPRFHTDGTTAVSFEKSWPAEETDALAKLGYKVNSGTSANLSAVALTPDGLIKSQR